MGCPRCGNNNRPPVMGTGRPGTQAPQSSRQPRPTTPSNPSVVSDAIRNAIGGLRYVPPTR